MRRLPVHPTSTPAFSSQVLSAAYGNRNEKGKGVHLSPSCPAKMRVV
jgi:hypothetical protein